MWKRHGKNNIYLIKSHNTVVATFQIKKIEGELHLEKLAIIPKYQGKGIGTYCIDAIEKGVNRVHILDGRIPHCLLLEIFTKKGIGTAILRNGEED